VNVALLAGTPYYVTSDDLSRCANRLLCRCKVARVTYTNGYLASLVDEAVAAGQSFDGSADEPQLAWLAEVAAEPSVLLIGEIGFNAGLTSHAFLQANPRALVWSFDLFVHTYVPKAKWYIDEQFPGRHTLICGDSRISVPSLNPFLVFDLVLIDGSHDYDVVVQDIANMRRHSGSNTIVVMDDLTPWEWWGEGPTRAWQEAIDNEIIIQDELIQDGKPIENIPSSGGRSYARGRYL
jgi:hypothetical protein